MNVGIVTTWFERGAANVSRAYMEALAGHHRVFVYARAGERYAKGEGKWDAPYVTWGQRVSRTPLTYVDWDDYRHWVGVHGLDVVIFNEQRSWDVVLKALQLDATIGAYVDYYTPETVPFFWLYDFLLCNTARHYSVFKEHPHALHIPWGTDLGVFKPRSHGVQGDGVTFFHSCGVSPLRKGTDVLVSAFRRVSGKARLIVHSQGPLLESPAAAAMIAEDPRIELVEAEVGAPGLYQRGDVYVYPTRIEGIGLTVAEALASGLPVVTTDDAPMNEFVVHGLNGRLVRVVRRHRRWDGYYWPESICDEGALVEDMQFYVDNKHDLPRYRDAARAYAEKNLDWRANARDLPAVLASLPRGHRAVDPRLRNETAAYERCQPRRVSRFFFGSALRALRRAGAWKVERAIYRLLSR
jgi:glycosyltransferase involved in cell wall biosynthesis